MWKYIGIQIGYALSGKLISRINVLFMLMVFNYNCAIFLCTAWIIYTVVTLVILLALGLIYFGLVHFTDLVIGIAVGLL